MKLSEAKDLVINQGYAIHNDDTVEKLNEVFSYIKEEYLVFMGGWKYYSIDKCRDKWHRKSINLSEIELPNKITLEMVVDLRKQYPNNLEFGDAFDKLLNN